jgi:hypothetical protein
MPRQPRHIRRRLNFIWVDIKWNMLRDERDAMVLSMAGVLRCRAPATVATMA